jgi:limonene 1,2-monooxygenase
MAPYSDPLFDIAVAAVASPTGARLAGTHGLGLLSIGATLSADGFDALAHHWNVMEERAAAAGTTVDRSGWRLVGPFHLAETEEQARKEVAYGIEHWFRYFQHVAAFPQMAVSGDNLDEMIDFINTAGIGVIGTADQARAQVQRLVDQAGGFGTMLLMGHDWADPTATKRSFEIFARDVAPHFQGQAEPTLEAARLASAGRDVHSKAQLDAVAHMTAKYEAERAR